MEDSFAFIFLCKAKPEELIKCIGNLKFCFTYFHIFFTLCACLYKTLVSGVPTGCEIHGHFKYFFSDR